LKKYCPIFPGVSPGFWFSSESYKTDGRDLSRFLPFMSTGNQKDPSLTPVDG